MVSRAAGTPAMSIPSQLAPALWRMTWTPCLSPWKEAQRMRESMIRATDRDSPGHSDAAERNRLFSPDDPFRRRARSARPPPHSAGTCSARTGPDAETGRRQRVDQTANADGVELEHARGSQEIWDNWRAPPVHHLGPKSGQVRPRPTHSPRHVSPRRCSRYIGRLGRSGGHRAKLSLHERH